MKDHTYIGMLLDRSGSMSNAVEQTLAAVNDFIAEQQKVGDNATIRIAQFGSDYDVIIADQPIKSVTPLTEKEYVIDGMTALLDSTGKMINDVGQYLTSLDESERPNKVIIVVMTDGRENVSKEYNSARIKEMIKHQEDKYNWSFVFLGAEIGTDQAVWMGFGSNASASYTKGQSMRAYHHLSQSVAATRAIPAAASLDTSWKEKLDKDEGNN